MEPDFFSIFSVYYINNAIVVERPEATNIFLYLCIKLFRLLNELDREYITIDL